MAGWRHVQPKGWRVVNHIRQETGTRYVKSEVVQLYIYPLSQTGFGITHQYSISTIKIVCAAHFPPDFSLGLPCQKNGRTGLQPL